jgi:hypothetical protein
MHAANQQTSHAIKVISEKEKKKSMKEFVWLHSQAMW